MAALHGDRLSHAEGPTQVFHALMPIQPGLRCGVPRALESLAERLSGSVCKKCSQHLRLVEAAFALARTMQRDGDEGIPWAGAQTLIFKGSGHPLSERMAKVEFVSYTHLTLPTILRV